MLGLSTIAWQLILLGVLVVSTVVGYLLINKVPPTLHTPLMSGMNALSGVTVLGALAATAAGFFGESVQVRIIVSILGAVAVALAMVNVAGGFAVTDRMLAMIARKSARGQKAIYTAIIVIAAVLLAAICCLGGETLYFIVSAVLVLGVLCGIAMMSRIDYSRIGNRLSAVCMLVAIVVTMVYSGRIYAAWPVYAGLAAGILAGLVLSVKVSMLQMPQMVALLNGLGGCASALVGAFAMFGIGAGSGVFEKVTSSIALAVGAVTFAGSLVAAGKLHRVLPQKPVYVRNHFLWQTLALAALLIGIILYVALSAGVPCLFCLVLAASLAFGLLFSLKVGGADMPITISLLNSLSGVAGAIAGLAIGDFLLVAIGGIVGASGLLLTRIMCKAMNRSLGAILSGRTTTAAPAAEAAPAAASSEPAALSESAAVSSEPAAEEDTPAAEEPVVAEEAAPAPDEAVPAPAADPTACLKAAKEVIIVPGYGMAIAQAQHVVKQLADRLKANGTTVKYAVHPVAGRMPGHMNVLLCEADVDYEDLFEMDDINPEFKTADATFVIGANDVTNPAASTAVGTPIYGMPVLAVNDCSNIFVFNFDLKPGYAGVENPIYTRKEGVNLYLGNAAETLSAFLAKLEI